MLFLGFFLVVVGNLRNVNIRGSEKIGEFRIVRIYVICFFLGFLFC